MNKTVAGLCSSFFLVLTAASFAKSSSTIIYGAENARHCMDSHRGTYYVALGAFSKKANADRMTHQLVASGYHAQIMSRHGLYQVLVGPFNSSQAVRQAGSQLLSPHHASSVPSSSKRILPHRQNAPMTYRKEMPFREVAPSRVTSADTPVARRTGMVKSQNGLSTTTPAKQVHNSLWNNKYTALLGLHALKIPRYHSFPTLTVSAGGFRSNPKSSQLVAIQGGEQNYYQAYDKQVYDGLVGVGVYMTDNNAQKDRLQMAYGINAYYLANTSVKGYVVQDTSFSNLSFQYTVTHFPIYVASRAIIPYEKHQLDFTVDLGIGPNFMVTSGYNEKRIYPYSVPDNTFSGTTTGTLSATFGVGIRKHNLQGRFPIDCGYRLYYLGRGALTPNSSQVVDNLLTGNVFANALLCTVMI